MSDPHSITTNINDIVDSVYTMIIEEYEHNS